MLLFLHRPQPLVILQEREWEKKKKKKVWKVREVQGLSGCEKKQKQMALVVEGFIKMEA